MVLSGIFVGCGKSEKTFKAGETSYRCQGCRQERRPAPDFSKDGPILRCPLLAESGQCRQLPSGLTT